MDYVIHSFGGGETLMQVFNAVGRIFASNSEYFTPVGKYAMTTGALWAGMKAIFKGNINEFGMRWLFPSFFAFVFLFTPKATVWIKDEVAMNAPVKVDNIPFGIAFFSSVSSEISYYVSHMLEKHLLPVRDGLSINKTGLMYGAKLVGKIGDVQIQDQTVLRNTKEFMRQCFLKPYIIGDLLGKKGAAQKATDIIEFLEQNPVNNFGIYYRNNQNHTIEFKTCKQVVSLIKLDLNQELNGSVISRFANLIGMHLGRNEELNHRLKVMTSDTLQYLHQSQADLHGWMKQAMLLNANREALDDWRERYSLNRFYPSLVSMNATRGMFQQSFSWLTSGEMAANIMPILQSAFFSLIICLIFIVFPMAMLPGGYNILKLWISLMIWVNSWPVFFTVIHSIGMISLSHSLANFGNGNSILSQGSFSEIALNSYATYQMLAASVPMLSYAVLKGCMHATTSLVGAFSPATVASHIGSSSVDNNLSMDNISLGSRSIGQANYTPTLNMAGGIIDDGGVRVTTTSSGGQIINQALDNMATNYRFANQKSTSMQSQLIDSQMKMGTLTNRYSELQSIENRQLLDLAERFVKGEVMLEGLSDSQQESYRQQLSQELHFKDNLSYKEGKSTATNASGSIGYSKNGTGFTTAVSASNNQDLASESSAGQSASSNNALENFKSIARSHNLNSNTETSKSLVDSFTNTRSQMQSVGQEIAQTEQTMQSLQHSKSYLESNSAHIDRNFNESVLEKVMELHQEVGSKAGAAQWISEHSHEADQIASGLMSVYNPFESHHWSGEKNRSSELRGLDHKINDTPMMTKQDLDDKHYAISNQIEKQATIDNSGNQVPIKQAVEQSIAHAKEHYQGNPRQVLYNNLSEQERASAEALQSDIPEMITSRTTALENQYNDTSSSTVKRTLVQGSDNVKDNIKEGKEFIKGLIKNDDK